jgi:hypothetical protein
MGRVLRMRRSFTRPAWPDRAIYWMRRSSIIRSVHARSKEGKALTFSVRAWQQQLQVLFPHSCLDPSLPPQPLPCSPPLYPLPPPLQVSHQLILVDYFAGETPSKPFQPHNSMMIITIQTTINWTIGFLFYPETIPSSFRYPDASGNLIYTYIKLK